MNMLTCQMGKAAAYMISKPSLKAILSLALRKDRNFETLPFCLKLSGRFQGLRA